MTTDDVCNAGVSTKTWWHQFVSNYRLTQASTTAATSSPYIHTFTYTALGNIATSTKDSSTFGYGYAGTNYANPHAATQIASSTATTTYAYDHAGNLTSTGSQTNTWDYRNRLISVYASSSPSTFYLYDHTTNRVAKGNGTATTTYPSKYYELTSATSTKYIWAGDTLLATIEGNGQATSTYYSHPDYLGSTNAVTDSSGSVIQTLDYYPYGDQRINSGSQISGRQFIGERYDTSTDLNYLNARYYAGDRGQFLSEDPVFWEVGQTNDGKTSLLNPQLQNSARTMGGSNSGFASGWNRNTQSRGNSIPQAEWLADPQIQNSYSYARGNPLRYKDPDGNFSIGAAAMLLVRAFGAFNTGYGFGEVLNSQALFRDSYSDPQRSDELFRFGFDIALTPAQSAARSTLEEAFLILAPTILDGLDSIRGAVQKMYGQPSNSSIPAPSSSRGSYYQAPTLPANASTGTGGMVRNMVVGSMPSGAPIYCSGLCGSNVKMK